MDERDLITDPTESDRLVTTPVFSDTLEEQHLSPIFIGFFIILESLTVAAILLSSALILLVICRTKTLQTSRNYYVISLVLANTMAAAVAAPALIVAQFTRDASGVLCKTHQYFIHLADSAEVFTLCCISYDRYRTIVGSMDRQLRRRTVIGIIVAVWILAAVYASESAILFTHETLYIMEDGKKIAAIGECALDRHRHGRNVEVLLIVSITLLFIVPLLLLTVLYGLIYFNLGQSGIVDKASRRRKKVFRTMLVLIGTFFCCNLPLESLVLYINVGPGPFQHSNVLEHVFELLALLNVALNALIYAFLNENFKTALREVLRNGICGQKQNAVHPFPMDDVDEGTSSRPTRNPEPPLRQAARPPISQISHAIIPRVG